MEAKAEKGAVSVSGRSVVIAIGNFATLVMATLVAAAAALGFDWLLLNAAFQLMRPATARRSTSGGTAGREVARGTLAVARVQVAPAFAPRR
jgi:hypothetical protein